MELSAIINWHKSGLHDPWDTGRLPKGNTLIAEQHNGRIIEVDSSGTIIWQKISMSWPADVEKLENVEGIWRNCPIKIEGWAMSFCAQ